MSLHAAHIHLSTSLLLLSWVGGVIINHYISWWKDGQRCATRMCFVCVCQLVWVQQRIVVRCVCVYSAGRWAIRSQDACGRQHRTNKQQ